MHLEQVLISLFYFVGIDGRRNRSQLGGGLIVKFSHFYNDATLLRIKCTIYTTNTADDHSQDSAHFFSHTGIGRKIAAFLSHHVHCDITI